jgi:uncharacterized protein (UPF0332 family)
MNSMHKGIIKVLQECYKYGTSMLKVCHKFVTSVLRT